METSKEILPELERITMSDRGMIMNKYHKALEASEKRVKELEGERFIDKVMINSYQDKIQEQQKEIDNLRQGYLQLKEWIELEGCCGNSQLIGNLVWEIVKENNT